MIPRPRLFDVEPGVSRHPLNPAVYRRDVDWHNAAGYCPEAHWYIDALAPIREAGDRIDNGLSRTLRASALRGRFAGRVSYSFWVDGTPDAICDMPLAAAVDRILTLLWEAT